MLASRVIPCLDVMLDEEGNSDIVKGEQFEELRYAGDPVERAGILIPRAEAI